MDVTKGDEKAFSQDMETTRVLRGGFAFWKASPSSVTLQLVPEPAESVPEWGAERVVIVETLRHQGALAALVEEVTRVRTRMGTVETIDVLAVRIGDAVSGMPPLQSFFERTRPSEDVFLGLVGRTTLPSPAALSRCLSAMTQSCVEGVRQPFERFRFGFAWTAETLGGLTDRGGQPLMVFDVDGTRAVARHRRLPASAEVPPAHRRREHACAVGSAGRTRGDVVRSRMTALTIHPHQWVARRRGHPRA
jgi:hypothetical protein